MKRPAAATVAAVLGATSAAVEKAQDSHYNRKVISESRTLSE